MPELDNQNFDTSNRQPVHTKNILFLLGDLLNPQTEGFKHINMDMSFSNLDYFDLTYTENSSFLIVWFNIHALKKCSFIERNKLATRLIAKRSFNAKSMELFTNTVNVQKQQFEDKTEKKKGFFNMGKPKQENEGGY